MYRIVLLLEKYSILENTNNKMERANEPIKLPATKAYLTGLLFKSLLSMIILGTKQVENFMLINEIPAPTIIPIQ